MTVLFALSNVDNTSTTGWSITSARKDVKPSIRGRRYFASRVLHTANGRSTFQLSRNLLSGDIHPHPGPAGKRTPKYPCKECGKNVRSNQDAILCVECNLWSHAKCLNLTKAAFKYYLDNPNIDWTCSWCSLPFRTVDYSFEVEKDHDELNKTANSSINTSNGGHANETLPIPSGAQFLKNGKTTQAEHS